MSIPASFRRLIDQIQPTQRENAKGARLEYFITLITPGFDLHHYAKKHSLPAD